MIILGYPGRKREGNKRTKKNPDLLFILDESKCIHFMYNLPSFHFPKGKIYLPFNFPVRKVRIKDDD